MPRVMPRRRAAVIVGAVALLAAAMLTGWTLVTRGQSPLERLVVASATTRFFEPRVTGGFHYARLTNTRGAVGIPERSTSLLVALADADRRAQQRPSAENLSALATALIVNGYYDRAISHLEEAIRLEPRAERYSDLAAARLVRASQGGGQAEAVRALDAALKAIRLAPALSESRFNAALALEANYLREAAAKAWRVYLQVDPASGWADEARARTEQSPAMPDWTTVRAALWKHDIAPADAMRIAVDRFPQNVHELVEDELLPHWAALEEKRPGSGCAAYRKSRDLAAALAASGGDTLLADVVATFARGTGCPRPNDQLRQGLAAYAHARHLILRSDYEAARTAFENAVRTLERLHTPLVHWARANLSYARYQTGQLDAALGAAKQVEAAANSKNYGALLARSLWLQALVLRRHGYVDRALGLASNAIAAYEGVRELAPAGAVASTAADMARTTGQSAAAWRLLTRAVATIDREPSPIRRYLCFYNMALFARRENLLDAAHAFQTEAVTASWRIADRGMPAQALGQRAFLEWRLDNAAAARRDLERARTELQRFTGVTRRYLGAELDTIEAALVLRDDPERARVLVSRAATVFTSVAPEQTADAQLAIGRAALALGDASAAAAAFVTGIEDFEARRARIAEEDQRIAYFGTARDLYREMIALRVAQGDTRGAFEFSDRVRARALLDLSREPRRTSPTPLDDEIVAAMEPRSVFLLFAVQPDAVWVWMLKSRATSFTRLAVSDSDLGKRILTIRSGTDLAAVRTAAAELHDLLVRPLALQLQDVERVYISPDGPLHELPFALLLDRSRSRYFVEDHTPIVVPSAAWFVASRAGPRQATAATAPASAIVIGNPAFDAQMNHGLARLFAAEQEARTIAAHYERAALLTGDMATYDALVRQLPSATVMHFAGHSVQNSAAPNLSYLLLTPGSQRRDEGGRLHASDIATLPFGSVRLVVLGACSTARGVVQFGEGALNIARPFLAAGVPAVIASLRDIDDAQTAPLMIRLHQQLLTGRSAAESLRAAQIAMIREARRPGDDPRHWAAFSAIGDTYVSPRPMTQRTGGSR